MYCFVFVCLLYQLYFALLVLFLFSDSVKNNNKKKQSMYVVFRRPQQVHMKLPCLWQMKSLPLTSLSTGKHYFILYEYMVRPKKKKKKKKIRFSLPNLFFSKRRIADLSIFFRQKSEIPELLRSRFSLLIFIHGWDSPMLPD